MISTLLSPKSLALVLIVFTVFTVSLTENLQLADALSVSADKLKFDIERGDTQLLFWSVRNTDPYPIEIEFYATGPGADLLVFEQFSNLEPAERKSYEILVSVPIDYENNVEYRPVLHALQRSQDPTSTGNEDATKQTATAKVNVVMKTIPIIRIGENPIYTPPEVIPKEKDVEPEYNPSLEKAPTPEEKEQVESIQQKLDRIQAANDRKTVTPTPFNVPVDDEWREEFEEEAVKDYVPEPTAAPEEIIIIDDLDNMGCGFIDWLLSLFGMAKC